CGRASDALQRSAAAVFGGWLATRCPGHRSNWHRTRDGRAGRPVDTFSAERFVFDPTARRSADRPAGNDVERAFAAWTGRWSDAATAGRAVTRPGRPLAAVGTRAGRRRPVVARRPAAGSGRAVAAVGSGARRRRCFAARRTLTGPACPLAVARPRAVRCRTTAGDPG